MKSQKGMTLVGVLVAVAVMGILAATLTSIYEGMSRVMRRTSMQNEVDNLQRYIQGVLSQKVLCDKALRLTFNGAEIVWDYKTQAEADVPVIQLWNPKAVPPQAISVLASTLPGINPSTGLPYNQVMPGLSITSIKIRILDKDHDGVLDAAEQKVIKNGQPFFTIPAEIVIGFQGQANWSGGVFKPRAIPIMAVFQGTTLKECDVVVAANEAKICKTLTQAYADQGYTPATGCPIGDPDTTPQTCSTGPKNGIAQIVFFDGYDSNNNPKCNCQRICGIGPASNPGVGIMGPGPAAPGPAAPGPAAPGPAAPGPSGPGDGGGSMGGSGGDSCGN